MPESPSAANPISDWRAKNITERQLQEAVTEELRSAGWKSYHTWSSLRSPAGFPDILACREDRLLALELKSERGKATPAQIDWLIALQEAGAEGRILRPSDWISGRITELLR